jgi:amino acid adenylation domain-containing protein
MIRPFDLQNGPLFRVYVHQLTAEHHYFTLVIHHLIGDGWSLGIILEDLSKLYNAAVKGTAMMLQPGPQISGYAEEQASFLQSAAFGKIEQFWLALYKDTVPVLDLPTDYPRPATRSYKANRIDHPLPVALIDQLKETGAKAGSSLVNTLLSAFEIYLYQLTGQREIVVGLPTAGQSATENFDLVGHCVNLLPLKSNIAPDTSFLQYLKDRKTAFFDAYEHQQLSFGQLLKKLNVKRDHSRVPLVPVVFNIDMGMDSAVSFDGIVHQLISNPRAYETFEIFLNATGSKSSFTLEWTYNTQLFKASTIQEMTKSFEELLTVLVNDSTAALKDVLLQSPPAVFAEEGPLTVWPENHMVELFYHMVAQYPNKTAISFKNATISYKDLNEKSNQLAAFLIEEGIQKGDFIGLSIDRSMEMVIALLGVMKSGAVYLPLDPEFPRERISFMLNDSSAKLLLASKRQKGKYQTPAREIIVEELWPQLDQYSKKAPEQCLTGDDLCYILYTSGSTGKPKGVKITHGNLLNFLRSMQLKPGITENDRLLAITTISFDIAGLELYLPLISGAEIVLADAESSRDGRLLLSMIEEKEISIMQATPSTWRMMIDSDWQKKYPLKALSGGEALPKELADLLLSKTSALWNMYGPTETTIWSTVKQITERDKVLSIGSAIHNTQVYIMDEMGQPVPPHASGEIYIAGDGVAAGYLNRTELSAEKFVDDPFSKVPGAKFYKTGDLGKLLDNGEFQCLGRIDQQVKIRGHRIELGEIESIISVQQGIKQSVVLAREDTATDKRLVAYVLLDADNSNQEEQLAWKDRWDTLYDIGAASNQNIAASDQNLDDTLLAHYDNHDELALQSAEWLNASVERIKEIGAKTIYEIGSGAGQLLFELAPETDYYIATDYAQTAIHNLNEKLNARPEKWAHVKAKVAAADDFESIMQSSFDLVLIHSVAQYFPNAEYLIRVIKASVKSTKEGGCVFIGDMQGKNSLEMCHAMDHLSHSPDSGTMASFKEVVKNRVRIEDELVADPAFFYKLPELIPEITGVDVQLRKGRALNETTKYHYDVWLYTGTAIQTVKPEVDLDWNELGSMSVLEAMMAEKPDKTIALKNIINTRTAKDYHLLRLMKNAAANISLKSIKAELENVTGGIDPDLFYELAGRFKYHPHIRWSTDGTDGLFEVIFVPESLGLVLPPAPFEDDQNQDIRYFSRIPFSKKEVAIPTETVQKWKENLWKTLPAYMVPEEFIALTEFPLTPNAKIDRNAFPKPNPKKASTGIRNVLPKTKNEQMISTIWSNALGLEDLKTDEDFFELGGHSLLAVKVMVAIEKETGKRLPLSTLFENSTIEKLAKKIEVNQPEESWTSLVPIRTTGTKTPLFLIHGGGLNILLFKSISQYLNNDQPVYGIQALGLNKAMEIPTSLKEIAKIHVNEILKADPDGPYSIAGYSLGGFIAFEIARQLKEMGKEIKMLGVMDTNATSTLPANALKEGIGRKILRQFYKIPFIIKSFIKHPAETIAYQSGIVKRKLKGDYTSDQGLENYVFTPYELEIYKVYDKILDDYILIPFDVKVTLFRVEKRLYYLDDQVYLGWDKFAQKGVEIHSVPGDHKTFLYPPYDKKFAGILQRALDQKI